MLLDLLPPEARIPTRVITEMALAVASREQTSGLEPPTLSHYE
jgi:hypothetical protein